MPCTQPGHATRSYDGGSPFLAFPITVYAYAQPNSETQVLTTWINKTCSAVSEGRTIWLWGWGMRPALRLLLWQHGTGLALHVMAAMTEAGGLMGHGPKTLASQQL